MKRRRLLLTVLLTAIVLFSAYAGGEQENGDVIVLKMIAPWADKELDGFLPVIKAFEEANPGIKIEYRTGKPEDTATMLSTQFAVGKAPADIIDTAWSWYIAKEARKGNILEVSDVVSPENYRPGALDDITIDGKIYGVTGIGGLTMPEFNSSLYRENNLKDPRTVESWDELVSLMDDIKKLPKVKAPIGTGGGVGWTNTSVVETWILTFGGVDMYMSLLGGNMAWDSEEVVSIFRKYLLPLLQNGYFGEPEEVFAVTEGMWKKEYGFFVGGTTDSLRFNKPSGDWGVFTLPGQKDVVMWTDFWFIPTYTQHPEEAKKLLEFLATEGQSIQIKGGGRIATYINVPIENYPPQEQMVVKVIGENGIVPDMDDTIGGKFQTTMWDQLMLLWVNPTEDNLRKVFSEIEAAAKKTRSN